jgi:3'-5' exoribonuclease
MARAKPAIVSLSELKPGELGDCFVLLVERMRITTQSGKQFFNCRFRDAETIMPAVVWSDSKHFVDCESSWQPGQCYKLRAARKESDKYGPSLEIDQIRLVNDGDKVDGFEPLALIEPPRVDPNQLFDELRRIAEANIADVPLRELVVLLLDQNRESLLLTPGSAKHYYPFAGGWLEHTLGVTKNCHWLGQRYREQYPDVRPQLNMDLLLAGAMLHDIGRVAELGGTLMTEPTVPGRLLGHLQLGRDLVRAAARDVPDLDAELLLLLDHLILSHLTLPEWGSPRLPAIPEVLILHHADDLDAKMEMYIRCLMRDHAPGPFTDKDPMLGKQLYKGRKV